METKTSIKKEIRVTGNARANDLALTPVEAKERKGGYGNLVKKKGGEKKVKTVQY